MEVNVSKPFENLVQEARRVPNDLDPNRITPGHIILKMPKLKIKRKS